MASRIQLATLLLLAAVPLGCKSKSTPAGGSGAVGSDASAAAAVLDAAVAAVTPDAVPAIAPTPVADLLAFPADAPPTSLLGVTLGVAPPDDAGGPATIDLAGCGDSGMNGANVRWTVDAAGKVAHVTLEIGCSGAGAPELTAADVAKRAAGWGAATELAGRQAWRGPASTLTVAEWDGFLRGTPSVVIDLLPPGDRFACGTEDGSAAFFGGLRAALLKADAAKVAAMVAYPASLDDGTEVASAAELVAHFEAAFPAAARKALLKVPDPICNLSREAYWWDASPGYVTIARQGGAWKAAPVIHHDHDTDLDPRAP